LNQLIAESEETGPLVYFLNDIGDAPIKGYAYARRVVVWRLFKPPHASLCTLWSLAVLSVVYQQLLILLIAVIVV